MSYIITEQDIDKTLNDFEIFYRFIEERKPTLTKVRQELGKKECFELNKLLSYPKPFEEPKYLQIAYPSINLWFHICMASGIFTVELGKGNSRILVPTRRLELLRKFNPYTRYIFLFKVFWTMLDWDELYLETMNMLHHFLYIQIGLNALKDVEPGERISADVENFHVGYDRYNPIHRMFVGSGIVIHHLQDFGFWRYERAYIDELHSSERDIDVKSVTLSKLGTSMIKACLKVPLEIYNPYLKEETIRSRWSDDSIQPILEKLNLNTPRLVVKRYHFEDAFIDFFPEGSIEIDSIQGFFKPVEDVNGKSPNVYIFKVSLGRSCWCKIEVSSIHTLMHLHEAINEAFNFWGDHLYAFFMDGKPWSKNVYWDKGAERKPTADSAVIGSLGLFIGQKFLYLFDFGDEWHFNIKVEDMKYDEAAPYKPVIMEIHGDRPEQY